MRTIVVTAGGLFLTGALGGCQSPPAPATRTEAPSPIERGKYLVSALGCNDCHTPKKMTAEGPVPDMTLELAGHNANPPLPPPPTLPRGPWGVACTLDLTAWSGPWGVSYAINLTPDEDTGIGIWTEDMFRAAIRTGKHMGQSRPILPPMPWQDYRHLTDDDLKAVFAYLKSIPPIKNRVPEPVLLPPPSVAN